MTAYIQATYVGSGHPAGYYPKQAYNLEVRQHWFGRISIRPTHGYAFKPLEDMRLQYRNLAHFFSEWQLIRHLDPKQD